MTLLNTGTRIKTWIWRNRLHGFFNMEI